MIYIYSLSDPDTGSVRYVGKTTNIRIRMLRHLGPVNLSKKHHTANWLNSLMERGLRPVVSEVEVMEDGSDWEPVERKWIAYFKNQGCDLTNCMPGGEGGATYGRLGKKNSEEHIKKSSRPGVSVVHTEESNRKRTEGVRAYYQRCKDEGIQIKRKPCSEERKKKIGDANRGRKIPLTEARKNAYENMKGHLAPNKGVPMSVEAKSKISASKKGKPWTEARRLAQSNRAKKEGGSNVE